MKAQSTFIGFLIAIVIIALILIPTFLLILDYSKPSTQPYNLVQVAENQINGGTIIIYFNSTPTHSYLIVPKAISYAKMVGVFSLNKGQILNITSQVNAIKFTPNGYQIVGNLPSPLIYNFTLPNNVWNTTLILQLTYYNVTIFATIYPNETAFSS